MPELKRTPLHDLHVELGARMVEFAGWHMPAQYAGVVEEHLAVRRSAGVFDVSHMGEFSISGPAAADFLQFATTNDVARLRPGRSHYTLICDEHGGVIDDAVIYRLEDYLLVVNAANTETDLRWLEGLVRRFDAEIRDRSAGYGLLALQGPEAKRYLQPLCGADPGGLRRTRIRRDSVVGYPALVARTGYTGEDGFELFASGEATVAIWKSLIAAGVTPVGLGARNTLRLEAGMALHGHELSIDVNPLEAGLRGVVKLDKGDFCGSTALRKAAASGVSRKLFGIRMEGRAVPRDGYTVRTAKGPGTVTSGTFSPTLGAGIAMALLPAECAVGGSVQVDIRGREWAARVVELPFFSNVSKRRDESS